jgi:hypothetical protein
MKRLFIIGNGFDLEHYLPTSYTDYRVWLNKNFRKFLEVLEEIYCFSSGIDYKFLWSEFEKALGLFDIEEIYNNGSAEIEFDEEHMLRTSANIEDYFEELGNIINDTFQVSFKQWISSVNNTEASPSEKYCFTSNDNFLTFNFTNTLERIYGISSKCILHIHGSIDNNCDLEIGYKEDGYHIFQSDPEGYVYEENSKGYIYASLCQLRKDTINILKRNNGRIISLLNGISEINVIGFSYSEIDFEYFEFIKNNLYREILWKFYYHNNRDLKAAQLYSKELGITPIYLKC